MRHTMRHTMLLALAIPLCVATLLLAACGASGANGASGASGANGANGAGYGNTSATPTTSTSAAGGNPFAVMTATATVSGTSETILTDAQGRTLYYFDLDTATSVACTGGCATIWPPLLASGGTPQAKTPLPGTLGTLHDSLGLQVTYNGHPLYIYSGDVKPGDTTGNGIAGKWHVATPTIAVLAPGANGSTATPTPTATTGY